MVKSMNFTESFCGLFTEYGDFRSIQSEADLSWIIKNCALDYDEMT